MGKNVDLKKAIAVAVGLAASAGSVMAQTAPAITTYADPQAALNALGGTATGFGPILFGMAVISSGIVLGIAWIKKSRSAAK